ncbi:MAG: hypothetical protein RI897_3830 [Verrucomicrobiota bacterium]
MGGQVFTDSEDAGLVVPDALPDAGFDGEGGAVFALEGDGAGLGFALAHLGEDGGGLIAEIGGVEVEDCEVIEFVVGIAEFPFDGVVPGGEGAVGVGDEDEVVDGIEESVEVFLSFLEVQFGGFTLVDIGMGAAHAEGLAGGGAVGDFALSEDPAVGAVLTLDAVFEVVGLGVVFEVGVESVEGDGEVIGMDAGFPFIGGGAEFVLFVAEHCGPFRAEEDLVGLEVPVPGALVGGGEGEVEAGFAFEEALVGLVVAVKEMSEDGGEDERGEADVEGVLGEFEVEGAVLLEGGFGEQVVGEGEVEGAGEGEEGGQLEGESGFLEWMGGRCSVGMTR